MLLLTLKYYLMLLLTLQVPGFTLSSWQVCVEYFYDILKATVQLLTTWTECQAVCCFNFIYTETVEQMLWFWYTDQVASSGSTCDSNSGAAQFEFQPGHYYPDRSLVCFPSVPGEARMVQVSPRPLPFISLPIHASVAILPFNADSIIIN
jgi:hypothetical protein